ncbi:hypothetical protein H6771_00845 [Candidatus Peribacteria bacterium]|nr:hypothetical protein [Candidatus Peribacteria bacterium]
MLLIADVPETDQPALQALLPEAILTSDPLTAETAPRYSAARAVCIFVSSCLSAEVMAQLPHLELIVTRSVGYDHIDLSAARARGITVCHIPEYGSYVIAEHVFALLLSLVRHIREGDTRVEAGQFAWQGLQGMALRGKTLGVVGTGNIGLQVCRIASLGFQMRVLAYDVSPQQEKSKAYHFTYAERLEELYPQCDVLSLHVPLLPATGHMINAQTLQQMKRGVILINTARGGLIDTPSLVAALRSGQVGGAGLDVLEHEANLAEERALIAFPQVITTPHIAFYADDSLHQLYEQSARLLHQWQHGQAPDYQVQGV